MKQEHASILGLSSIGRTAPAPACIYSRKQSGGGLKQQATLFTFDLRRHLHTGRSLEFPEREDPTKS